MIEVQVKTARQKPNRPMGAKGIEPSGTIGGGSCLFSSGSHLRSRATGSSTRPCGRRDVDHSHGMAYEPRCKAAT
jgi:hypothetical protein